MDDGCLVVQHKFYSRDILRIGRIKYDVTDLVAQHPEYDHSDPSLNATRSYELSNNCAAEKSLLKLVAAEIPKLKSRTNPPQQKQEKQIEGGKKKKKK